MNVLILLYSICFIFWRVKGEIEYYPSMGEIRKIRDTQKVELHTRFNVKNSKYVKKRGADPVFHGHPKTKEELWRERFLPEDKHFDQVPSLIRLVHNITLKYLTDCTPVLLYDNQIFSETKLFQELLRSFPVTFIHGYIDNNNRLEAPNIIQAKNECLHFILFLTDVQKCHKVLGTQSNSKVVVIARSSQWAVQEYLANPSSRLFINLLIVSPSFKDDDETLEASYILYTHDLYTDGLGSSKPHILTSWIHGKFTRNINLFPLKMMKGYAGHRFLIAVANQPPYTIKRSLIDTASGAIKTIWDGVEIRIMKLLAERNNFSIEFVEPRELNLGPGDSVANEVSSGRADIGIAGLYATAERFRELDLSFGHSQDCAAFITLASTALPRYRAILGPFHWHVWVALTFTYLIAIFPFAFSDRHTLSHLINNSGEVENMFWYVFGTFTNCFTFVGKYSWSKTDKVTTRLLIGWYWLFTIIITSCYTGSIIAFVTLPIYPETIDTVNQLLSGFFRVGTLVPVLKSRAWNGREELVIISPPLFLIAMFFLHNVCKELRPLNHVPHDILKSGGWERWFLNSSDKATRKLLKHLEFVPDIETGIRNVTKAFFWPYAFLGSKAELEYLVQSNFSMSESKRAVLHISNECFVPFTVSYSFPNNSAHTAKLSKDLSTMFQSGIVDKITQDVMWEIQKKGGGKLLTTRTSTLSSNSIEEKGLTLEDTQGMFLLLGAGFLLATIALLSEWMGGFSRRCRQLKRRLSTSVVLSETSRNDSRLHFNARSTSVESKETLDGQIIHVSQESITIHNNYDGYDSRRSSSLDLDKEVERIFRRDEIRRLQSKSIEERVNTASKVFGDQVFE